MTGRRWRAQSACRLCPWGQAAAAILSHFPLLHLVQLTPLSSGTGPAVLLGTVLETTEVTEGLEPGHGSATGHSDTAGRDLGGPRGAACSREVGVCLQTH